jgi:hypothetical protein
MRRIGDSDLIERVSKNEEYWVADLAALESPEAHKNMANLPTVRRRPYQSGVRLAMVLNQAFSENLSQ